MIEKTTIDPTANVLKLVDEAVKRINDLIEAKNISDKELNKADEKLRDYQIKTITEILNLHVAYKKELDTANIERANASAALLANTVRDNFELLRRGQETQHEQTSERLTRIENVQAETKGKTAVYDPMMNNFLEKLDKLLENNASRTGKELQTKNIWTYVTGAAAIFGVIVGIVIKISEVL